MYNTTIDHALDGTIPTRETFAVIINNFSHTLLYSEVGEAIHKIMTIGYSIQKGDSWIGL